MTVDDRTPFASPHADLGADAVGLLGGQHARDALLGDQQRAFRLRVVAWSRRHGFVENESCLERVVEGVHVSIPLYEVTSGTAILRARTVRAPIDITVSTEPQTWLERLKNKLRRDRVTTSDAAFDAAYFTVSSDGERAALLLDARCIAALRAMSAWCRLSYQRGDVEARIDVDDGLAGTHLLEAEAAVVALALAEVPTLPYR